MKLIEALTTTPVLSFADFSRSFVVHIDASFEGLGAILSQETEGVLKPIAFASRKLTASEKRYPVHKLEFLALKWAVCDKFHDYLYASEFLVLTDNNPLTYVMKSAKLDATGLRWVAELSLYNFAIKYTPGRSNIADALSRMEEGDTLSPDSVRAICRSTAVEDFVSTVSMSSQVIEQSAATSRETRTITRDWPRLQAEDDTVGPIWRAMKNAEQLEDPNPKPEVKRLWSQRSKLFMEDDVLYRSCKSDSSVTKQLVLPSDFQSEVLKLLHDDMGHLGRDRVLHLVRQRFYWSGMFQDVVNYVSSCASCQKRKGRGAVAELGGLSSGQPMELVCMDFLGLESSGGFNSILVLTDHFTRFAMAVPTRNQKARTTAKALIDVFINHYGLPQKLHSDQGANFTGKVITEMCRMLGIKRSTTSGYHPMGNGQCELFNRTLLDMLGTLPDEKKAKWKDFVQPMLHAYNCTKSEVTGYTPFELMFGRRPRLPIDHHFGLVSTEEDTSYNEYVEDLKDKLEESYRKAQAKMDAAQGTAKGRYDRKVRGNRLEPGDFVFVRKTKFQEGKHKLANKWEDKIYVVQRKIEGIPVFELRPEDGRGKTRRLHRNNLLPVSPKGRMPNDDAETSDSSSAEDFPIDVPHECKDSESEHPSDEEGSDEEESHIKIIEKEALKDEESTLGIKEEPQPLQETVIDPPVLRRSTRRRQPPSRYRTGEYVMHLQDAVPKAPKYDLLHRILDIIEN